MLSDEEKTTLEFIKINNEHKYCDKDDVDFLLNLIEKTTKEIEELKNKLYYKNLKGKIFINEDLIKAKIEELEKDKQYSANPLSIDNSKFGIKVLQSLLKEE